MPPRLTSRLLRRIALSAALPAALAACGTVQTVDPGSSSSAPASTAPPSTAPSSQVSSSVSPGTGPATTDAATGSQRAALEAAERQWASMGIGDYRFTLVNNCFCIPAFTGPIEVVVIGGQVESMILGPDVFDPAWAGSTVPPDIAGQLSATAEALFELIRGRLGQKDFRAVYDEATGFPLEFYSDPIPEAADDEFGFRTAAFEAT